MTQTNLAEAYDRPQLFNNTTRFLAVLVAVLSFIAIKVSQTEQASVLERKRVFLNYGFDPDDFETVTWVRGPELKEKLSFRRYPKQVNGRSWEMLSPFQETAEGTLVKQILQQCSYIDYIEKLPVNAQVLNELGLAKPLLAVQLTRKDGSQVVFRVGQAMSKLESHAIQFSDQKDVAYLVTNRLISKFLKPINHYRNQDLFQLGFSKLTDMQVTLHQGVEGIAPQSLKFNKNLSFWRFADEKREFANVDVLQDLYKAIDSLVVAETLSDVTWTTEQQQKFGLQTPLMSLRLKTADSEETAVIGQLHSDQNYYMQFGKRPTVYTINIQGLLERLLKPVEKYRSRQLLPIANSTIETLTVQDKQGTVEIYRDLRNWKLRSNPEAELNQDKARQLLTALIRCSVSEFDVKDGDFKADLTLSLKTSLVSRKLEIQAIKNSPKEFLVRRQSVKGIVKAKIPMIAALREMGLSLRRPEILNFDQFATAKIELVDDKSKVIRLLTKDKQEFVDSSVDLASLNKQAIKTYIGVISRFRAKKFLALKSESSLKEYDLATPQMALKLYSSVWDAETRSQKPLVTTIQVGKKLSKVSYAACLESGDVVIEIDNIIVDAMRHGFAK